MSPTAKLTVIVDRGSPIFVITSFRGVPSFSTPEYLPLRAIKDEQPDKKRQLTEASKTDIARDLLMEMPNY